MAVYARARKLSDDGELVRYEVADVEGKGVVLVLDRRTERIYPEQGERLGGFHGIARKLSVAFLADGSTPETIVYQA